MSSIFLRLIVFLVFVWSLIWLLLQFNIITTWDLNSLTLIINLQKGFMLREEEHVLSSQLLQVYAMRSV